MKLFDEKIKYKFKFSSLLQKVSSVRKLEIKKPMVRNFTIKMWGTHLFSCISLYFSP